jgi:hypothetical protein
VGATGRQLHKAFKWLSAVVYVLLYADWLLV